ncbi:type VI secretion system baseplate subunit TssK [Pseudoalteromonas sp. B193]
MPKLPKYDHENLGPVFSEVVNFLYQSLSHVIEQTATEIKLEQSKFGISFGALKDKSVLSSGQFVLAIKASVPHEELRKILPSQIKIGSVETIRDLVNNQIPGITISNLPTAPRQIPYHAGFHYFELNKHGEHWAKLHSSGGIAIHLSEITRVTTKPVGNKNLTFKRKSFNGRNHYKTTSWSIRA